MSETEVKPVEVSATTKALAAYISQATRRALPKAAEEKTKHHVLDTIAAMVSGMKLPPGRKAISYARSRGGVEEASVVGTGFLTTAENAAMANGMLAHADETDDSHAPSQIDPGCGIVAAALAMAEREDRDGAAFIRAVALGYDVGTRLTMSLNALVFREDGHSTHSFGPTFGATAAAGSLARLNQRQTQHLLTYAAQQASGVGSWIGDLDHIEKAFDFGGMPARNGVTAAAMVKHGFTATDDAFTGPRNFFLAYRTVEGLPTHPEELVRELGSTYEIMNTNIKRWSVGSPIQAPLDSLSALIHSQNLRVDDVEHVLVQTSHTGAVTTDNRDMPDICMQHLCAVMLLDGTVTFESSHDKGRMNDPVVRAVRGRIELKGSDELQAIFPARVGEVYITLRDGRKLHHRTSDVRGTAENPMTRDEVDEKAFNLLAPVLSRKQARALCDVIWSLDSKTPIRALRPLLKA